MSFWPRIDNFAERLGGFNSVFHPRRCCRPQAHRCGVLDLRLSLLDVEFVLQAILLPRRAQEVQDGPTGHRVHQSTKRPLHVARRLFQVTCGERSFRIPQVVYQCDVVVESNTVADGAEMSSMVITEGIPETVQAVKENNRALIAPLKGVHDRLESLMLPQHIVSTVR